MGSSPSSSSWALSRTSTGSRRRSSTLEAPAAWAKRSARRVAARPERVTGAPLWTMALANRPRADSAARSTLTEPAPADSPKTVTSSGSPPKAPALAPTQRSASIWSSRPQLPPPSSGWDRKPSAPSR